MRRLVVGLLALGFPEVALATGADAGIVLVEDGPAGCPSAAAVAERLQELRAPVRVLGSEGAGDARVVRLLDAGPRYQVGIAGERERWFVDERHDCDGRARATAVYLALRLERAAPAPAPAAPPAPPQAATRATPAPTPALREVRRPPSLRLAVEIDGRVDVAAPPAAAALAFTGGSTLRVLLGLSLQRTTLSLLVDAAGLAPFEVTYPAASARLARVPCFLGLRGSWAFGRLEPGVEVGALVTILLVDGRGLPESHGSRGLDWGARGALLLGVRATARVAPFVRVELALTPDASRLSVTGIGVVGQLPSWWVSAAAGLGMRFL